MKKYLFLFLSMFSRFMLESFGLIYLLKNNYELQEIFFFLVMRSLIGLITLYPIQKLITVINIKKSYFISLGLIILNFYFLKNINLILLASTTAIFNNFFYLIRHFITLSKQQERNISFCQVIVIINMAGSILGSSAGLFIMELFNINILMISCIIIYIISFYLLENNIPTFGQIKIKEILKLDNYKLYYILEQFKFVEITVFPIFLYLYIDKKYQTLANFTLIVGLASGISLYFIVKDIKKNNKDYLRLVSLLFSGVLLVKLEITNLQTFIVIALLEGITSKLYETISLSKAYKNNNYNLPTNILSFELFYAIGRTIIFSFAYFSNLDLKILIYILILGIMTTGFIRFKTP